MKELIPTIANLLNTVGEVIKKLVDPDEQAKRGLISSHKRFKICVDEAEHFIILTYRYLGSNDEKFLRLMDKHRDRFLKYNQG